MTNDELAIVVARLEAARDALPPAIGAAGLAIPHDPRAESAVLGAMLLSAVAITDVAQTGLCPAHFYQRPYRYIATAILGLNADDQPADAVTVAAELESQGQLDEVGGAVALLELQANTPRISSARFYAEIVIAHELRRRIIALSNDVAGRAYGVGTLHGNDERTTG